MPTHHRHDELRLCAERFVADLTETVTRVAFDAVRAALDQGVGSREAAAQVGRVLHGEQPLLLRAPAVSRAAAGAVREADVPLRLEAYERHAILRALAENEGNMRATVAALRTTKSTLYRRMMELGIPRGRSDPKSVAESVPYLHLQGPVSFEAYERRALERADAEARQSGDAAWKLLGVGRSTFYRHRLAHGLM